MSPSDLPAAMRLSREAGWNQVEGDWLRFLSIEPEGCFVAESDGVVVGTTVGCTFGTVAWVAMVLVAPAERGQGVATSLTQHAIEWLEGRGVRTIRLDATPAGQPIYQKLGFDAQYELARYGGRLALLERASGAEPASPDELNELIELDQRVTKTPRAKWLTPLFADWPEAVRVVRRGGEILGFAAARRGVHAIQVGPCVGDAEAAALLFRDAGRRYGGQAVYIDVPLLNPAAAQQAEAMGLRIQRHLLRMCRGELVCEDVMQLWSSSGPEMG